MKKMKAMRKLFTSRKASEVAAMGVTAEDAGRGSCLPRAFCPPRRPSQCTAVSPPQGPDSAWSVLGWSIFLNATNGLM